jgi:hypothetical protein
MYSLTQRGDLDLWKRFQKRFFCELLSMANFSANPALMGHDEMLHCVRRKRFAIELFDEICVKCQK